MNRVTKKLLAVFLTVIMVLALLPAAAFAEDRPEHGRLSDQTPNYGYIASPEHGTHAVSDAYKRGDMETYYRLSGIEPKRDTLPSSYDSRNYNYVTSVKNQNPYGSCWAHAAMASVESYMIKHGIPVGTGSAATTSLNLSETQHCFFNYTNAYDAEGMLTGDKSSCSDGCLDQGGNGEMSAYTLQRWAGAADESASALAYSRASTVASSGLNSQYAYGSNVSHVQNSEWIPGTDIEGIKHAIMEYGAGNISYYETGNAYTYICTKDTTSQDSSSHKWANHAITLVGWDDTIKTSAGFKPNTPSSTGAWICKNSWGTSYFSSGYCYISYEDTSVLEGYIYFYDAEPIDNYDHNYQYDGTCNVVCYGKGWPSSEDYYVGFANNTKVANVFTANGSELLEAVALCNWDEALSYTVEIYKNPTTGNPSSGTLMTSQSGTLTYSGYYTIKLDHPVTLAAGDTFSVVFTQSCPEADDSGKYIHTPYDATFNNSDVVSWASWTHANHGNTSYYQEPNGAWTDCPDNGDYRIKAYTVDYDNPYTVTAVSNDETWGTVSVTGTKITATPADGYYVSDYEVISGTATATIDGNIINVAPESDCTIKVIFAPKPTYTVNYIASGKAEGQVTALHGNDITLPSSVSVNPDGWMFSGWVTAQLAETTDEPAFYEPGASYTVLDNATLYALYTRIDGDAGEETVYELVTSKPSDWAGNYVITNSTTNLTTSGLYVLKGVSGSAGGTDIENANNCSAFADTGITLTDNVLHNVADTYVVTLDAQRNYYSIRSASTGTYYGMNSSSYLYGYSGYNSSYCRWTPGINNNGIVQLKNARNGSYPYFSWSTTTGYFWSGSSKNANVLRLWKENQITSSVTYYTTDPVVQPLAYFMKQNVVLSGQIAVNFYLDLSELSEEQMASSYMTFDISGRGTCTERDDFDPTCKNATGLYYGFTCQLNSVQMADTITATYHYGDGLTVSKDYSVKQYLITVEENANLFNAKIVNVLKALGDYGHYVQLFLAEENHWTIGTDYAEMDQFYTPSYDIDAVRTAVAGFAAELGTNADIEEVKYTLVLDSETAIKVFFKLNSAYTGSFSATIGSGTENAAQPQADGRYMVVIPNIRAQQLGTKYTIKATTDSGTAVTKVAGLSYVQNILNNENYTNKPNALNGMASLYYYYLKAYEYATN